FEQRTGQTASATALGVAPRIFERPLIAQHDLPRLPLVGIDEKPQVPWRLMHMETEEMKNTGHRPPSRYQSNLGSILLCNRPSRRPRRSLQQLPFSGYRKGSR